MRLIAPIIIACGLLLRSGLAQHTPKDPQSSFEPRSTPGLGQKYLQKFVGDWEVQKVFYPATGEPVRAVGGVPAVDDPEWKVLAVGIRLRQGGPEDRRGWESSGSSQSREDLPVSGSTPVRPACQRVKAENPSMVTRLCSTVSRSIPQVKSRAVPRLSLVSKTTDVSSSIASSRLALAARSV